VFLLCSCILLIIVVHFCLVHYLNSIQWLSWCSSADWLFIRVMPAFYIFICCLESWSNNDLMIIAVLFSMSVPINLFHYQLQVLTFNKVRFYVSLACNL
jgi:hypothetical protein